MPSKAHLEALDIYYSFWLIVQDKSKAKQCASFMADKIFNMQHPSMSAYEHWREVMDEIKKI